MAGRGAGRGVGGSGTGEGAAVGGTTGACGSTSGSGCVGGRTLECYGSCPGVLNGSTQPQAARPAGAPPTCGAMRAKMRSEAPGCAANSLNSCSSSMLRQRCSSNSGSVSRCLRHDAHLQKRSNLQCETVSPHPCCLCPSCARSREGGAASGVTVEHVLLEADDAQVGLADGHRPRLVALVAACAPGSMVSAVTGERVAPALHGPPGSLPPQITHRPGGTPPPPRSLPICPSTPAPVLSSYRPCPGRWTGCPRR